MLETLYQTADAETSLSDSGCRKHSYHTADAGHALSESGCRSLSITQWVQESLNQITDAGDTLSDAAAV